ncbi:MAG: O-antigen ligase family protein [Acidobacteriota bacterium]|nr:O-antigen ligase family protein [Acidobacteriota bacterium]
MKNFFNSIDEISGIETDIFFARWLERAAFVFLFLMVLSAPHSIAATQIAWLLGMLAWVIRLFAKPRPKLVRTPLDAALWTFFGWTIITSIFSYAPDISVGKLRGAALFLIFYFVAGNVRHLRAIKLLAFALIFSCMVSVVWSPIERIIGRGLEISGISTESLLTKAVYFDHGTYLEAVRKKRKIPDDLRIEAEKTDACCLIEDDTIVEANGKKIRTPNELAAEIEKNEITYLECFRTPNYFTIVVKRENLLDGASSLEKLGISEWKHSRNWRYSGFYGQIITYAEVLQLITSLVFGLFIASISKYGIFLEKRENKKINPQLLLIICLLGMIFTLSLTFTRAAQLAFLVSAVTVVFASGNRKLILTLAAVILPLGLTGLFFLQAGRQVGFYDEKDDSIIYRQTIYREGFDLWTSNPRQFFLGVGMDSTKRYAADWRLFDNGKLPSGHFHSTPLQLLVERGLPGLLLWLWGLWIYAKMLWRNRNSDDWLARGIILGCFGGLVGFFTSSLVNYSLGDSEVAMVFYLLMGLSNVLCSLKLQNPDFKVSK